LAIEIPPQIDSRRSTPNLVRPSQTGRAVGSVSPDMRVPFHRIMTDRMRACGQQKSRSKRTIHAGFLNPQSAFPDLSSRGGNASSRIPGVDYQVGGINDEPIIEC
jgi:hypothetical protein